jgi:hypothetical protein
MNEVEWCGERNGGTAQFLAENCMALPGHPITGAERKS